MRSLAVMADWAVKQFPATASGIKWIQFGLEYQSRSNWEYQSHIVDSNSATIFLDNVMCSIFANIQTESFCRPSDGHF